jgi:hypothetical protein
MKPELRSSHVSIGHYKRHDESSIVYNHLGLSLSHTHTHIHIVNCSLGCYIYTTSLMKLYLKYAVLYVPEYL